MRRLSQLSARDLLFAFVPAVLLIGAVLWVAQHFVRPAPPRSLTMSAGAPDGAYGQFAQRYKAILARDGVELKIRSSSGAVENLARLEDPQSDIDVALVQSGLVRDEAPEGLVSLGSVFHEPLWVFYRGDEVLERLSDLRHKRVAVGAEGSGTRRLALAVLAESGISRATAKLVALGGDAAVNALQAGQVDSIMLIAAPESEALRRAAKVPGVRLMNFVQAEAYARRNASISHVVLPRGTLDLQRDIPPQTYDLISPTAMLIARADLHPALVSLLLGAVTEVHGGDGLLQKAGDFPAVREDEFRVLASARRYIKSGPPFLQQYLPFWIAVLADRLIVLIVPLVALAYPLMRITPALYAWRIRSRIHKLYGELRLLDDEVHENHDEGLRAEYAARLDRIEDEANHRRVPLAYASELYDLRQHIQFVRNELDRYTPPAPTSLAKENI